MNKDLSELDEWLGTLELLQQGLQTTTGNGNGRESDSLYPDYPSSSTASTPILPPLHLFHGSSASFPDYDDSSNYHNQQHGNYRPDSADELDVDEDDESNRGGLAIRASPHHQSDNQQTLHRPVGQSASSSLLSYSPRTTFCPSNSGTVVRNANFNGHATTNSTSKNNGSEAHEEYSMRPQITSGGHITNEMRKDIAASKELDSLLKELSVIEQEMQELENMDDDFTKRYSLASSTDKASNPDLGSLLPLPRSNSPAVPGHGVSPLAASLAPPTCHLPHGLSGAYSLDSGIQDSDLSPNNSSSSTAPCVPLAVQNPTVARSDGFPAPTMTPQMSSKNSLMMKEEPPPTAGMSNPSRKVVVRIFHPDRTTKAIMVEEKATVREICNILLEKNFCEPNMKLALVEKVPSLKMEHCFEDHEYLADCILSWPSESHNMIFFEEREDKFGLFLHPKDWLGVDLMGNETQEKFVNEIVFAGVEPDLPEWKDYLYIKKPAEKTWTRKCCLVRNSGLYASKRKKSTAPQDLVRILVLDAAFHLYTTTGGWTKLKAPTPYGFALKTFSAQDPRSKLIFYFCASDETALKRWITLLRIAKYGKQLLMDYKRAVHDMEKLRLSRISPAVGLPISNLSKNPSGLQTPASPSLHSTVSSSSSTLPRPPAPPRFQSQHQFQRHQQPQSPGGTNNQAASCRRLSNPSSLVPPYQAPSPEQPMLTPRGSLPEMCLQQQHQSMHRVPAPLLAHYQYNRNSPSNALFTSSASPSQPPHQMMSSSPRQLNSFQVSLPQHYPHPHFQQRPYG